ncbi:MAG TPA: NADH-quinone oxidoreductase subunit D [Candidatus Polarisedimenticolia bacterium]|nr:NADH-quinone oxidoreductase subunit D [Candidatus Polarisedimenticolia bacterium]
MFRTEMMEINMGPQHPSTHGVLRLELVLDGETVVDVRPVIGYLHRGVEKLSEHKIYVMVPPLCDRLDYVGSASQNLGYLQAVEKLSGIEVPERARYIRTIITELNRISSHLVWLGTHALDIGAMTVFFYCFREREMILDLFEAFCGARLTTNMFRVGGILEDLPPGWVEGTRRFIDLLPGRIEEYEGLLSKNRIWLERTKGVGLLDAKTALSWGVTGPMLRAAGVGYDIRKTEPYAAYDRMEFDVPTEKEGDTYARYLVRLEEMRQSARIIRQGLDALPGGDIRAPKLKTRMKPPAGEVYHEIEGPRGVQGFYIVSDGGEMPYRCHFRAPSFVNLAAIGEMSRGGLVADIVAVIGTIDIVLGDCDR